MELTVWRAAGFCDLRHRGLTLERRTQGREQAIADGTQSACMAMASLSQGIVASSGGGIVLDGDARPVMDGVLQPPVAGEAADHEALSCRFAASPGQPLPRLARRGNLGLAGLCGLGEQCGEDDPADSRPGAKDRHVTLLMVLPRRVLLVRRTELAQRLSRALQPP